MLFKWDFYQLNNATSPSTMAMMQMMHMHIHIYMDVSSQQKLTKFCGLTQKFLLHKTSVAAYGDETDVP